MRLGHIALLLAGLGLPLTGRAQPASPCEGSTRDAAGTLVGQLDGILFVGLIRPNSPPAVRTLQQGSPQEPLTDISRSAKDAVVREGSRRYDLGSDAGVDAYIASLGFPPQRSRDLASLLKSIESRETRDEARQVILAYARAEETGTGMRRVVLSGHSNADGLDGDNGALPFAFFSGLAKIFPAAAGQVQHLMVGACYTGGPVMMKLPKDLPPGFDANANYHEAFPGLKTITAYAGASPSVFWGWPEQLKRWERATQGRDVRSLPRNLYAGTRYEENIATWSIRDGYVGQEDDSDEEARVYLAQAHDPQNLKMLAAYYTGEKESENPMKGELKAYYDVLQRVYGNALATGDARDFVKQQVDLVVKLRYYPTISQRFSSEYAADLQAGYSAAWGQPVPRFDQLSRRDALAEINRFLGAEQGSSDPAVRRCIQLLTGYQRLSEDVIHFKWV